MSDHRGLRRPVGRPLAKRLARYVALADAKDPLTYGVWDRRGKSWAQPPFACDEVAERLAAAATKAFAAGLADGARYSKLPGLRFAPASILDEDFLAWGVRDRRLDDWADRPCWNREWAERMALMLNEACAAGLAEARIEKAR